MRARRTALEHELDVVAGRREAAEEALAARSAQREELSRRAYVARAAAERVSYRAEAARSSATAIETRLARATELAAVLRAAAGDDRPDDGASARIAALEADLAALDRDREAELGRQLEELERERAKAGEAVARQNEVVQRCREEREAAEGRMEEARAALREAERAVEGARREAARVGGELAGVNHFLRGQAGAPGDAPALADELDVDEGYELALAAALDGRLRAAVVEHRNTGAALLDRAGADGGRALVTGPAPDTVPTGAPPSGAEPLIDRVRGRSPALALARALLRDAWIVDDLTALSDEFEGVAVTRAGRVWSSRSRELRQAPAVGEERVLAERNRREQLVRASEAGAQAELDARAALEAATADATTAETARDRVIGAHRRAVRTLDEAAEEERRIGALIQRRRAAPDDGANAGRRSQLAAELAAERQMLARAQRERSERAARIERLDSAVTSDRELLPVVQAVIAVLQDATGVIAQHLASFDQALVADRQAGEHVAVELRTCAQQEAGLHSQLQRENETLTEAEVRLQRARDQAADSQAELQRLAAVLELEAKAAEQELAAEAREDLSRRLDRLARRREQLGPVNPLAQEEYAEALEHVEELETQRADLETALRELEKLIADTDREIRSTFEQTFAATASGFEELAAQLFPGGSGRLRLVSERPGPARVIGGETPPAEAEAEDAEDAAAEGDGTAEEDLLGVEIEITPAGKECKRLSLLSGGEKSMTALAFLFAVFLARPCPFYILDEVEAALDDLNIDRFLALLRQYSSRAQFIVVTHQKRTMEAADSLYGVSMGSDGISKVISRRLAEQPAA